MACGRWRRRNKALHGTPHGPLTRHDESPWDSKHHAGAKANRHGRSSARSSRALGGPARSRRKSSNRRAAQAKGSGLEGPSGKVGQAQGDDAESYGWSYRIIKLLRTDTTANCESFIQPSFRVALGN